ncbi:hypothetical protein COY07_04740 [Candidatus Peregrinibacteria bacterium CG_4_10_14_0_2_um_filter_43_11]|nr:MAG: hypothetical protein COY07_04740 [Candidatus Peregrinibacteria bacterium CG_4_10_14_0_2_um_filter_43_11]
MKKLLFVFLVLVVLIAVAGCNARKNTVQIKLEDKPVNTTSTTVITPVEEEGQTEKPLAIKVTKASDEEKENSAVLAVTSVEGGVLETNVGYHIVRGTVPQGTQAVKVNDYTLVKFLPWHKTWTYIASTSIGTLKEGKNNYTVLALDKEGGTIDETGFEITYTPSVIPHLPGVGTPLLFTLIMTFILSLGWFVLPLPFKKKRL